MQVRERSGVKQAELAKRVSLSPAVLSRIESGDRLCPSRKSKTSSRNCIRLRHPISPRHFAGLGRCFQGLLLTTPTKT